LTFESRNLRRGGLLRNFIESDKEMKRRTWCRCFREREQKIESDSVRERARDRQGEREIYREKERPGCRCLST